MRGFSGFLMVVGFGSALLSFVGYSMRILSWADSWQPGAGLAIGGVGLLIFLLIYAFTKSPDEQVQEQAPHSPPAGFPQQGYGQQPYGQQAPQGYPQPYAQQHAPQSPPQGFPAPQHAPQSPPQGFAQPYPPQPAVGFAGQPQAAYGQQSHAQQPHAQQPHANQQFGQPYPQQQYPAQSYGRQSSGQQPGAPAAQPDFGPRG